MRISPKRVKKRMTRAQFERLIRGTWVKKHGDRYRRNGPFETRVEDGWKYIYDGEQAIRAKTWYELAEALRLIADSNRKKLGLTGTTGPKAV